MRRIDPVLPNVERLNLENNPLDNRAHEIYFPVAQSTGGPHTPQSVTIDTGSLTIAGDDADPNTFYGTPFTAQLIGSIATFFVAGDLNVPADTITIVGPHAASIVVGGDATIDPGATFDLSAAGAQAGPGGGVPGSQGNGGGGGSGGNGGGSIGGGGGGGSGGNIFSGGRPGGRGGTGRSGTVGTGGTAGNDASVGNVAVNNPTGGGTPGTAGASGNPGGGGGGRAGGSGGSGGAAFANGSVGRGGGSSAGGQGTPG